MFVEMTTGLRTVMLAIMSAFSGLLKCALKHYSIMQQAINLQSDIKGMVRFSELERLEDSSLLRTLVKLDHGTMLALWQCKV